MNDLIRTALAWFGGLSALGYVAAAIYLGIAGVRHARHAEFHRTARRAALAPISELDIDTTDFDAELVALIEGDQK